MPNNCTFSSTCPPLALLATLLLAIDASAQRDLTDIPQPNPVAELAAMKTDETAVVNLFAADPDISKPIQMNFDSAGGLWIASSEVYPQIKPGEKANDKIIVLRDTDNDGVSDERTVFADGLLIPTGVVPDGPHAAYVAESTRLLYLQDTDMDGKADKQRIVLSGFGTEDTHHLVHTLRLGPDGCLYFNQSIYIHSHIETPLGTRHLDGGGIWRYRPSTGELEVFCKGFVNPWGHVFDHVGESFATDGAYFEGINYVFPDSVFVTSPGATRWLKGMNPGSPKHCGIEILSGTHIPPQWRGDFVANDFRSHRVCRFTVKPGGSGYISRQQPEIITTQHVAFRPIDARMGPDGALYIADWYNPIIQHGEVDFRDERRDRTHGRIWRVSFPGRPLDPWPDFSKLSIVDLIHLLEDPALPVRQFSRQELWQRASTSPGEVTSAVERWARGDDASRALELSWLDEVIGQSAPVDLSASMASVDPDARRTLLRSLWRRRLHWDESDRHQIENAVLELVADEDPRVRLEAVVCAGQLDADDHPDAIAAVLRASGRTIDDNLDFAIWQSLRKLDESFSAGSVLASRDWRDSQAELAHAVSAIGNAEAAEVAVALLESSDGKADTIDELVASVALSGNASQLGRVVKSLIAADKNNRSMARLKPLIDRTLRDGTVPEGVGEVLAASAAGAGGDEDTVRTLARVAAVWRVSQLEGALVQSLSGTTGTLRQQVIEAIGAFDTPSARKALADLAGAPDVASRIAATRAIAARRPRAAIDLVTNLLRNDETAAAGSQIVVSMLGRQEMPPLLAGAIGRKELPADLARSLLRRVQAAGGHEGLEQAIRAAGKLENAAWKLTPELKSEILELVAEQGSAARGEAIYRRDKLQCVNCHAIGTAGGLVGPNLISTGGSSQPDYILESLLEPSAKLKEGYTTLTVLTTEGEVINGIVIGNSEQHLRLRLADGKEIQIAVDDIEQQQPGRSLMPDGLLDVVTKAELVDLTRFLTALGRDPGFTVSTRPLVRSFDSLVYSEEARHRLNRTSTDTAASDDPAMQWRAMTTKVDGTIPLDELDTFKQHQQTPETSFIRFTIFMPGDGTAIMELPSQGIEAWVDTKPTPVWDLQSLKLAAGNHTIVLAIDRTVRTEPFTIGVEGDAVEAAAPK